MIASAQANSRIEQIYAWAARSGDLGIKLLRVALVVVLCWIGGLKFADYEAASIVPLVANSPVMSFFYHYPAPQYRLIALHPVLPQGASVGSLLLIGMSLTTLSFLITTPEAWVPALGDTAHGLPFLSGVGRLIVKDLIMLAAAVVTMADSAAAYLRMRHGLRGDY